MAKVKVEVLAEQMSYSYKNEDGTHTREDYVRGQVFEMDENEAKACAVGEPVKPTTVEENSSRTLVFTGPRRTPGTARAAVRIVGHEVKVAQPIERNTVTPAPAPKQSGSKHGENN